MAKKRLSGVGFHWSANGLTQVPPGMILADPSKKTTIKNMEIERELYRFRALEATIDDALKSLRLFMPCGKIHQCDILLSVEKERLRSLDNGFLKIPICFNPLSLLELPKEKETLGELAISWVMEVLEKTQDIAGFPHDEIDAACKKFREANYTYHFRAGEGMIEGSRVKARVDVAASCQSTIRTLTVLYRNKPLLSRVISEHDGCDLYFSKIFEGASLWGSHLVVNGADLGVDPSLLGDREAQIPAEDPSSIDLLEFPEVLELIQK